MQSIVIAFLRGYQYCISPMLSDSCRFWPNCSCYAIEAVEKHGALKGLWLSAKRVFRCNPWHSGGVDMVPDIQPKST